MRSNFIKITLIGLLTVIAFTGVLAQNKSDVTGRFRRKAVPEITWKNISPPFKDYLYYDYASIAFSPINAWWLSEAATLVYSDENFVRIWFRRAGLSDVVFLNKDSTQCFIASTDKFALVVFRGSEIWKKREKFDAAKILADLITDVDIRLVPWEQGGKVHRGFKNALDEVWPDLTDYLQILHRKGLKIWFGGHSLGAALATLSADRYPYAAGVYAFGSPRIGDRDFRDRYRARAFRIINNNDIVSRVPPRGRYRHVGEIRFIDKYGLIHGQIPKTRKQTVEIEHEPRDNYEIDEHFRGGMQGFIPDVFRDHVPLLYTVHLWNLLVENLQE
jgi:pimeloyl-ACP methyl ester carboxylesterase